MALLKNLVTTAFPPRDYPNADKPGLIYPLALVTGQTPYSRCVSPMRGAGLMLLPATGRLLFGEVDIAQGESIFLPIPRVTENSVVDAAIWWPEEVSQEHSDLDLRLRNASYGLEGYPSDSYGSVFERARSFAEDGQGSVGTWHLEIQAYNVSDPCLIDERQTVYWAAYVGPKSEVQMKTHTPP